MTSLRIDAYVEGFANLADRFPKATSSAINKVAAQARTYAKQKMTDAYNIKAKTLRPKAKGGIGGLGLTRSTPKRLVAAIRPSKKTIPLTMFSARWKPKDEGASVMIRRGARETIRGAFIREGRKSHIPYVLRRMSKEQYPIKIVPGVKIRDIFFEADVLTKIRAFIKLKFPKIHVHEIDFFKR